MEKDTVWKDFFSDKERYADVINGIGCDGVAYVRGADLSEKEGQAKGKMRDLLCRCAFGVNFALIGIENQEEIDYELPLRNMSYDVAEYEKQRLSISRKVRKKAGEISAGEYLYGFRKCDRLAPVITFVLYSGKGKWDGPMSLWEMLDFKDIPEQLRKMASDYKINVIEIRRFEHTEVFKTDVRQVFDFIRCSEDKEVLRELVESDAYYCHMEEDAYDVVAKYTNFKELVREKDYVREDGRFNMCTAIRGMIEDGRREGLEAGIKEGEGMLARLNCTL